MPRTAVSQSTKHKVRRKVLRSTERFWHIEDFDADTKAVEKALASLVDEGELEHVRRNTYWRGRRTPFGMTVAPPVAAVREVIGPGEAVGAAEWYATNLLGLSTQVSPLPVIAVSRRTPTGIPDVRIVNRASRTGRREAQLNDLEVTILEALDGWDRYVEVDAITATERFRRALADDRVRVSRLVKASRTESPRVRERLRYLLRVTGHEREAARIEGARSEATRADALSVLGGILA